LTQQFRIESESLRDKLNTLLPSQNRGSIGVDLSGSTTIIPIVDLTEVAEGSSLRQDLQTALSFTQQTAFSVRNATSTLINTTGYYRIFGTCLLKANDNAVVSAANFIINDGTTDKTVWGISQAQTYASADFIVVSESYDFIIKLEAGHSLKAESNENGTILVGSTRQLADLAGTLTNP
tara:strand:+ start:245 stop:781 length:537 start_codon:yes stop_codon:yes gene_type:complete